MKIVKVFMPSCKSLIVAGLIGAAAGLSEYTIDPATRTFRDNKNRVRMFHGMNVVVKVPPYLPTTGHFDYKMSLNKTDIVQMKNWGIRLVRLGVMWEAVETSPGYYDMDYLDAVESLIEDMAKQGITVIIDNH